MLEGLTPEQRARFEQLQRDTAAGQYRTLEDAVRTLGQALEAELRGLRLLVASTPAGVDADELWPIDEWGGPQ